MIQIENLNFYYQKKQPLFADLGLNLEDGKIYGLLGKNGTGKSTLLKLMTGCLFPQTGSVMTSGCLASDRKPAMLQDIFYLPEEYDLPSITITNYLKAHTPFYPNFNKPRFLELLSDFEVELESNLAGLSFGQKKKVMIAFGMAAQVKYLLMDEPTNGLDIPSKSQFRKALLKGFDESQIVIISTHQIRDLNQLIESVIILEKGQIIFHKDVFDIENKLFFSKSLTKEALPDLIHVENGMGGFVHITPNQEGLSSEVELEILFNAVVQNKELINKYL